MSKQVFLHLSADADLETGWTAMYAYIAAIERSRDDDVHEVLWRKSVQAVPDDDQAAMARGLFAEAHRRYEKIIWERAGWFVEHLR